MSAKMSARCARRCSGLAGRRPGGAISRRQLDPIAERLLREIDQINGGIGTAPKFPQCGIFELLWRGWKRTRQPPYRDAVIKALDAMCQGGIYDHLGGGFARYSIDARWLAPHFEKMLYDNAELVDLLTLVWQETKSPLYRQRIAETIGWVEREMLTPDGGFASSLDADSEHEEGKFYVWSEAEIDAVLGERRRLVQGLLRRDPGRQLGRPHDPEPHRFTGSRRRCDRAASWRTAATLLLQARASRVRPGWDDKVLADWNGLMIAALAAAGMVFERAGLDRDGAPRLRFHPPRDDRSRRAAVPQLARRPGAASGQRRRLRQSVPRRTGAARGDAARTLSGRQAQRWIAVLDRHYRDAAGGGYFFSADDTPTPDRARQDRRRRRGPGRQRHAGRGVGAAGDPDRRRRLSPARRGDRRAFSGEVARNFFPLATLLNNAELLAEPVQIVLVGEPGDAGFHGAAPRGLCGVAAEPGRCVAARWAQTAGRPPGAGKGSSMAGRSLCLRWPGLLAAIDRARKLIAHLAEFANVRVMFQREGARYALLDGDRQPGRAPHGLCDGRCDRRDPLDETSPEGETTRCLPRRDVSSRPISPAADRLRSAAAPAGSEFDKRVWHGDAADPLWPDAQLWRAGDGIRLGAARSRRRLRTQPDPDRDPMPPRARPRRARRL